MLTTTLADLLDVPPRDDPMTAHEVAKAAGVRWQDIENLRRIGVLRLGNGSGYPAAVYTTADLILVKVYARIRWMTGRGHGPGTVHRLLTAPWHIRDKHPTMLAYGTESEEWEAIGDKTAITYARSGRAVILLSLPL